MALETAPGKMFFDLRLPEGLTKAQMEECKTKFETQLHDIDPFESGTCSRIGWLNQSEIPTESVAMKKFINQKLSDEGPQNLEAIDPQLPGTYCYPGDSEICYHAYALELNNVSWGPDIRTGVKVVIVLAYETPFFFSTRELQRSKEKLDRAIEKVNQLERDVAKAKGTAPTLRKTGS